MKITCSCGNVLVDTTDGIAYKASFIADQNWFEFLDEIDMAIEQEDSDKGKKINELRTYMGYVLGRNMYQCPVCGHLYIDDEKHQLHEFIPVETDNTHLLKGI